MRKTLTAADIESDGETQARLCVDCESIEEYKAAMQRGDKFPPIVVFFDGKVYWLADGYHRLYATLELKIKKIACEVHEGTMRDALLYACGANSSHGVPRTNKDKRRAVTFLLQDDEWVTWSDRQVAKHCSVDHVTVSKIRKGLSGELHQIRTAKRGGTEYEMDTSKIGSTPKIEDSPRLAVEPDGFSLMKAAWMRATPAGRKRFLRWIEKREAVA